MDSLKGKHKVVLGKSFTRPDKVEYHTYRYDFKPASLDSNRPGVVEIGSNCGEHGGDETENTSSDGVSVFLPNVSNCAAAHTTFKGNRRPTPKECILVVNKRTGQITIERLSSAVHLKKTRDDNKQPNLIAEKLSRLPGRRRANQRRSTSSSSDDRNEEYSRRQPVVEAPTPPVQIEDGVELMEDADDGSGDESDLDQAAAVINDSILEADLHLSESGSDSD